MGYGFVIDYTERFRRVSEGLAVLQLSSGDEIELPVPAEHEIISKLSPSEQRFDAFELLCEFVRRAREDQHPDILRFRKAALKVAGFDPEKW
jgi:antitoxin component of MazEF toxin-antitoxin module